MKLKKIIILTSMILGANSVFAETYIIPDNDVVNNLKNMQRTPKCNEVVWNRMIDNYAEKRSADRVNSTTAMANAVKATPEISKDGNSSSGDPLACVDNAMKQVSTAMDGVNKVISIFSGTPDFSGLGKAVLAGVAGAACKQVNNYAGSKVGQYTSVINGATGTISGYSNTSVNVGGTSVTGGQVLAQAGMGQTQTNTVSMPSNQTIKDTASSAWTSTKNTVSNVFDSVTGVLK